MQSAPSSGAPTPPPANRNVDPGRGWLTDRPFEAPEIKKRFGGAVGLSVLAHALFFLILVAVLAVPGVSDMLVESAPNIVYVFSPGPGGGGGGGGNQSPEPARQVELEVPKPPVAKPTPVPVPVVQAPPQIVLPPITTQAPLSLPGANVAATLSTPSLGTGTGGGGGTGRGTGSGEGTGSGVGPGSGGGTGGGVYKPGSGVTNPEVISEKKPAYTAEAMRAKIQGAVIIEAIVRADGSVDSARVVRSLDKMYGLDQKALEAVRLWKFRPGRLKATNQPVDIMVTIELTFTLR